MKFFTGFPEIGCRNSHVFHDDGPRSRVATAAMRMQIGTQVMAALPDETLGKAERKREDRLREELRVSSTKINFVP